MTVATQFDTERSVNSNTLTMEETNIRHSSGLCPHTASFYRLISFNCLKTIEITTRCFNIKLSFLVYIFA